MKAVSVIGSADELPLRAAAGSGVVERVAPAAPGLVAFAIVAGLAFANGGYFPTSWGWASLAAAWAAGIALVLRERVELGRPELLVLSALAAFAAWTALSASWSSSSTASLLEAERMLVYVTAVGALLLAARRGSTQALLAGVAAAATAACGYALATRLAPDALARVDDVALNRLAAPLGYWNALGIFAAVGAFAALALAIRGTGAATRALAAAALVVLLPTLYFTFGRGSWIALLVGAAVALAVERERIALTARAAVVLAAPAAAVALAAATRELTSAQPDATRGAAEGQLLAAELAALALAAAVAAALLGRWRPRVAPRAVRAGNVALLGALAAALAAAAVAAGGPQGVWDRFDAPAPPGAASLNGRLFSLWSNGRVELWRAALDAASARPVLGVGAGGYEEYWLRHRPLPLKVRNAHSLYLETLAELGPVGLGLLVAALLPPLLVLRRARRHPLASLAAGGYAAFVVHAAADWDWQVTAVGLAGLGVGASLLVAARRDVEPRPLRPVARGAALALVAAVGAVAVLVALGNAALGASRDAAHAGRWNEAAAQARRAARWAPWSSRPLQALGEAELAVGDLAAARASFRRAASRSPRDWAIWVDLARASDGAARTRALARAARLNPLAPEIALFRSELGLETTIDVGASAS